MIKVSEDDLFLMLGSTIRYSFGRNTYMPSTCLDLVRKFACLLSLAHVANLANELDKDLELGLKQVAQRDVWFCVLAELAEELHRHAPKGIICGHDEDDRCGALNAH